MSSSRHPDSKLNPSQVVSNDSGNRDIYDVIAQRPMTRRDFFRTSATAAAGVAITATLGGALVGSREAIADVVVEMPTTGSPVIGFTPVPANVLPMTDAVTVPNGYSARTLVAWGDLIGTGAAWDVTQPMDEATQLKSFGSHTDGMHYFAFPGSQANTRGLLVTNSEYVDPALLNGISPASAYATAPLTLAMVRAQQAAHGVNVIEVQKRNGNWAVRRPSAFNRRITGNTPCDISGPAAGHAMMKTAADPSGRRVLGTLNNCAHGYTPWGTYLTCEENFNGYFGANAAGLASAPITAHERRFGVSGAGFRYRWHEVDPRFDIRAAGNQNEPNRFGWVVEVDPFNPQSTPVKRTAMGRFKHEGATLALAPDNTVAFYMGDDERNEYVYKFVCAKKFNPRNPAANRNMLDEGTLYVARFNADGTGVWLPLVWGQNGLTPANGFADQGEVLVKTRQAADRLGATMMDRPEWTAVRPDTLEVYVTLTNNSRRGNTPVSSNKADGTTTAASANPPVDAANPRPDNDYGHIIRWREAGGDVAATTFEWDVFIQCGDKNTGKVLGATYTPGEFGGQSVGYAGNINGDDFGAPDGLWFDQDGRLWVQTDQQGDARGDWVNIGGNVMNCIDPATRESRRFLTSPPSCEVTGVITTPDGKTMFVGIQHPGEDWATSFTENSAWPDNGANGPTAYSSLPAVHKPRSGIVVITKNDGGVIGT
ncbi:MAG: PhoX family protein [Burkholderiales bacterium]